MGSHKDNRSLAKRLKDAEVYDDFCDLLFAKRMDYDDLLTHTEEKWGVVTSISAISRFADSERSQYTIERAKRCYASVLQDSGSTLDQATRAAVADRLFNLAVSPDVSEIALLKMRDQEIKLAELDQKDRRLQLLETQMQKVKDALNDETLSEEDRIIKMRTVFGR